MSRIQIYFQINAWTLIEGDCPHFIYFQMMPFLQYFDIAIAEFIVEITVPILFKHGDQYKIVFFI